MKIYLILLLTLISCAGRNHEKKKDEVIIAVANYKLTGGKNLSHQVRRIEELAKQSQREGAQFLLLPELMIFDLLPENPSPASIHSHLDALALQAPVYEKEISRIGQENRIAIIGASVVVKTGHDFLNRAFYIDASGSAKYQDKLWPTPWEIRHGFKGAKVLKQFQSEAFSFAILICHDAEFPSVSVDLSKTNPEVIFVPSQTDDHPGLERVKRTSAARAIEQMSYVVMTGVSGNTSAPWHTYVGQNFLFTPQNKYFEGPDQTGTYNREDLSFFKISLQKLRASRSDEKQVNPARDSRPGK